MEHRSKNNFTLNFKAKISIKPPKASQKNKKHGVCVYFHFVTESFSVCSISVPEFPRLNYALKRTPGTFIFRNCRL